MGKLIDFDAFRAEQEPAGEPPQVKIGGQVYDLPSSLPASVALALIELKNEHGELGDVPIDALERMTKSLLGQNAADIIAEHSLTIEELGSLVMMCIKSYAREIERPNP